MTSQVRNLRCRSIGGPDTAQRHDILLSQKEPNLTLSTICHITFFGKGGYVLLGLSNF